MTTWVVLSGMFDPFHLSLGVLSSLWVARSTGNIILRGDAGPIDWRLVARVPGYLVWLVKEVVIANIEVFKLVLRADILAAISPQMFEFETHLRKDFSRWVFAQSITLTPGTVTVRVDGPRFIVHALTEDMAASLPGEMERRIAATFEPELELPK